MARRNNNQRLFGFPEYSAILFVDAVDIDKRLCLSIPEYRRHVNTAVRSRNQGLRREKIKL